MTTASKVYLHHLETVESFAFASEDENGHCKHKRLQSLSLTHTHNCFTCDTLELKHSGLWVYLHVTWQPGAASRPLRRAGWQRTSRLTQLTVWHQQNTTLWGAGGGSAAAPEPPSPDRCCKQDELEPRAQEEERTGHGISWNNRKKLAFTSRKSKKSLPQILAATAPELSNLWGYAAGRVHVKKTCFLHRCNETSEFTVICCKCQY